ncbi:MAG: DMT family transporter [Campylobacteraceae bacterium]
MNKGWFFTALTCMVELLWVYGFNVAVSWWHFAIVIALLVVDFYFVSKACEYLQTGTVYATFAGVGAAGATLMDMFLFDIDISNLKIFFIALIALGVIGLNLVDNREAKRARR